jgi:outer membrane lipoprotein-sorting protein
MTTPPRLALAALAAVAALPGLPAAARAGEPTAVEILAMVDKAQGNFEDLTTDSKLVVKEPGQTAGREYRFVTISRGSAKRLVRFLEPGDVKGMGMLIEGADTMYAFLPGFQKIRRLGTHVNNQSFMGSDVSTEDMAGGNMVDLYDAKLVETTDKEWVIELALKPGKSGQFPKRKMWVDKTIHQASRIEDYDGKGGNVRSTTRTDYRKDEGPVEHWTPYAMKIVDHRRNDHQTEILMLSSKVNQKVPDDVFSQRSLVRGQ